MQVQDPPSAADNLPPLAYVSISSHPDLEPVYFKVIKPVLEEHGVLCRRNENRSDTGLIIQQVLEYIDEADLVLCDLTHNESQSYYELGIAHAFGKYTVLISQETADIPFDTRYQPTLSYKDTRFGLLDLRDELSALLGRIYEKGAPPPSRATPGETAVSTPSELENARIALYHSAPDAKRYAMRVLGDNRDSAMYDRILQIVNNDAESPEVVRDGLTALHKITPDKALPVLLGQYGIWNPAFQVRERVVNLLGNYAKTPMLVEKMMQQITDSSWGVRVAVCQLLGKWHASEAKSVLQQRRGVDWDQPVRVAAEAALRAIVDAEQGATEPQPR